MNKIIFLRVISFVCIVMFIYMSKTENDKISYFYEKKTRKCTIISKDIRCIEHRHKHHISNEYNIIFICKSDKYIFDIVVNNPTYYTNNVGDVVHFKLSLYDMCDGRTPTKQYRFGTYYINSLLNVYVLLSIVSFVLFVVFMFGYDIRD